ncbi:MAG: signal peptidase I [Rhodoferax sp.]
MQWLAKAWREHRGFLCLMGLMMVFRSAVADWNYVPSSSMNPTLVAGDRVLVDKLAYRLRVPFTLTTVHAWGSPARGDVITFDSPRDDTNLIKRVVALAGDEVAMRDNQLFINGEAVPRQLVQEQSQLVTESGPLQAQLWRETLDGRDYGVARLPLYNRHTGFDPVQVPAGHVLVLGDSRDNSADSRFIGFIDVERITGRARRVVFSHDPDALYLPRLSRGWLPLDVDHKG